MNVNILYLYPDFMSLYGDNGNVRILAKRLEEVIRVGDPYPLFIDRNSQALKVLQHIRDEAHRFGITFHRSLRSKAAIQSDGYVVYENIEKSQMEGIVTLYCMAHARRKFEQISDTAPAAALRFRCAHSCCRSRRFG